jgi:dipeptide/tripeptide permease
MRSNKGTPVLLVTVVTTTAVLLWFFPTSRDFVVRAGLIGGFAGIIAACVPDSEFRQNNRVLLFFVLAVLTVGGYYWSRDHSFGAKHSTLSIFRLVIDYVVAAFAALFVSTVALQYSYSRKFMHGDNSEKV